ncbi:hypothetical protein WAF17_02510 [Bernardetia sp. ABR2-2B]|uniref:hypothetical protein n=1 Tax=Bernardetia sp. ABR2-2B TaxID=3127472 RepID=UPI0030D2B855
MKLQLLKKLIPSIAAVVLQLLQKKKQNYATKQDIERLELRLKNVEEQNYLLKELIKKSDN